MLCFFFLEIHSFPYLNYIIVKRVIDAVYEYKCYNHLIYLLCMYYNFSVILLMR